MLRVRIQSIPSSFLNTLKLSEDQKLLIISEEDVTIIDILCPGELILIKATKPSTPLIELPPSVLHSNFLSHHEDGRGATMGAKVRTAEWSPYFPLKSGWGCMVAVLQTNYHLQVYDSTGKLLFPLHPLLLDIETHGETDQDILHNTCLSWSPPFELADNPATYLATAGRSKFITLFLIQTLQNNHPIYYQISKLEHHTKAYITALSWTTTPQDTMILAAGTSSGSVLLFRVDLVSAEEVRAEVVLWRKICSEDGYFVSGLHFKNLNRLSMCNPEKKSSSIKNYDILCITKGFLLGLVVVPLGVLDEEMEKECDVVGNGQVQFYRIHENVISSIRWRKLTTSHDHELFSSSRDGTIKIWKVSLTDESDFRGVSLKLKGLVPVHDPDNSGIAGCEISPNGLLCIYLYLDSMAKGSDMYSPVQLANLDCHELITTAMTTLTRKETLIQFIDAIILGSKSPVIWSWDIKELLKQRNIWFSSEKILHPLSLAGIQCELLDHIITIYIKNSDKFPLYIVDRACKITNLLIPLIIPAINNYNVYKSRREKNDESVAVTPEDKKKKKKRRKKGSEEESDGTPSKKVKTIPAKDYFLIEQDNEQMQLHMDYIEQYSIQKLQEIVLENKKLISFMHISETLQRFFNLRSYTPLDEREYKCLDLFLMKLKNTENEATNQNLKVLKEQLEGYLCSQNIKEHSIVRCPFCDSPLEGGSECPLAHPVRVCSRTLLPITRYGHIRCANCEQMMLDLHQEPFGSSWLPNPDYPEYCPGCGLVVRKRVSEFLIPKQ